MKVLSLLFVLFPCTFGSALGQGPKPPSLAELAKYMGADRERVLYDGAKRESKIVWYTSLVPHKEIAKVFEAKYPGVAVETYRADGTDLSNRLLAETQAKRYIADAIETTPGPLMPHQGQPSALALQLALPCCLSGYRQRESLGRSGLLGYGS